jgi:hypothetical protein
MRKLAALGFLASLLLGVPVFAQLTSGGEPGTEEGAELVSDGANPVLRMRVIHGHGNYVRECYGYLYFSRDTIRYEVVRSPKQDGFSFPRTELKEAKEWHVLGKNMLTAELKFRDGTKYHLGHVTRQQFDDGLRDWKDVFPSKNIVDAALHFDEVVRQIEARNAERAPAVRPAGGTAPPRETAAPASFSAAAPEKVAEPEKPSVPAAPVVAPAPASLRIASHPGRVQVYLDNEPKGMTSTEEGELVLRNLPAGEYRVRLSLPDYEDWTTKVTLTAGQELRLEAKLAPRGPQPFTVQDVVDMLLGGISPKRAATLIQERGVDFKLDDKVEAQIRAAGGDSNLLLAIAKAKK